ncbi:MAG: formate dehydrogenase accessory sulfurtransferase FdhD [Symbiobacterium sp.]|uniref:formate dehydrogenase accessory sulfurtransferase FdhD n=1 Tax=Symbiobacterium sp. TaxID=1971213 RepID=UPI003463E2C3
MRDHDQLPPMPVERPATLYINDQEVVTLQTTPSHLDDWAIGFLVGEGIIRDLAEVARLSVDEDRGMIWADLPGLTELPDASTRKRYLTAGCGKGVTFSSLKDALLLRKVEHPLQVRLDDLLEWMKEMQRNTPLYAATGGVHAAGLKDVATGDLIVREDIGRHNALDKAIGAALRAGWDFRRVVALSSGRISYEAATKLGRAQIAVAVSLTAATDQAVRLASHLGLDLVGYARSPRHAVIYTRSGRVLQ